MSTTRRRLTDPIAVPDHIVIESVRAARSGNLRCRVCRKPITIGDDGTEFGHLRAGRAGDPVDGRCPHRPDSVDPTYDGPTPTTAWEPGQTGGEP
ncbi:hypothetical protein ACFQFH_05475 [Halobaculum halobium]|uniref:HNH endonuclease n=1 Tax=Halobaculum halobium TaxID=3032281 RepID=A0ABD5T824_9EURY|nr:hypothetical protein [Halobaculum sp. SYNS20]